MPEVFNLIDASWLPVRRRSGAVERIPPWRINDRIGEDPIVAFDWPRPDFNGAAHELLIGLLSTAAAPEEDDEWKDWWWEPPKPEILRERFARVAHAFDLDGDGPRFLQDLEPFESGDEKGSKKMEVSALLIDTPGKQTRDHNADLFVKRGNIQTLSCSAAAMALYVLSAYAPRGIATGGRGHRQSLRKAGPLTTLIAASDERNGDTLWARLWPNVETREQSNARAARPFIPSDPASIFPWLEDTRTSDTGRETTPSHVHPLHVYWGMPRRIRLLFNNTDERICGLTGAQDNDKIVTHFRIKQYGINYSDGFEHPLTPYFCKKAGDKKLPVSPKPGRISYRHWPGCVVRSRDELHEPAQVIRNWPDRAPRGTKSRIVAFGYFGAIGTEWKARAWIEGEMPLWLMGDAPSRAWLEWFVDKATKGAETVVSQLTGSVKQILYDPSSGRKPSRQRRAVVESALNNIAERFYRETEPAFYAALREAVHSIEEDPDGDDPTLRTREGWAPVMADVALRLFDEYAPADGLEDRNMERHVRARFFLALALGGRGKQGRSLFDQDLGIASPETARVRKGRKEAT